uniref:zinc-ribbon domain-containing protein n=1 Tax=Streptomyces violaceus TaxID=1936 RepID=UPI00357147C2
MAAQPLPAVRLRPTSRSRTSRGPRGHLPSVIGANNTSSQAADQRLLNIARLPSDGLSVARLTVRAHDTPHPLPPCRTSGHRPQWHPTLNADLDLPLIGPGSHKTAFWRCDEGHIWKAKVHSRVAGSDCPQCAGYVPRGRVKLSDRAPHLVSEWHPRNDVSPDSVGPGSQRNVWWLCPPATSTGRAYPTAAAAPAVPPAPAPAVMRLPVSCRTYRSCSGR